MTQEELARKKIDDLSQIVARSLSLLGMTGAFVLVAQATETHTSVITHGISADAVPQVLRAAYQRISGIHLVKPGVD